jgi:hypothetical protein
MLLILIPTLWLAVALIVIGICRMAGGADAAPPRPNPRPVSVKLSEGLTLWETPLALAAPQCERPRGKLRRHLTVHGVR